VLLGPNQVEWAAVPDETIEEATDALVRPLAVGACDIDRPLVFGAIPFMPPLRLGHEFVAEVVDVGPGVDGFAPGQRVAVPFAISCGSCDRCRRGLTTNCSTVPKGSMFGLGDLGRGWPGVAADLVRVPWAGHMLVGLPDGLDPVVAASISDNLPDAWRTVAPALEGEQAGADVLIVGGGAPSIALYAVLFARALGAGSVRYLDQVAERLALAERLGATLEEIRDYPRKAGEYLVTVDASAQPEGLACALRSTEPGGVCTSVGIYYGPETPMPLFDMYLANITFRTGRPHARTDMPRILDLVASGEVDPTPVQTVVDWEEAPAAWIDLPTKLVLSRPSGG
jgi:threonine dehydrogenase-like Zn-dependent dehydrogenase